MKIRQLGPYLRIGGVELPSKVVAKAENYSVTPSEEPLPYDFELEIQLRENRPPRCVRFSAWTREDGTPVTSDGLRAIPIAAIVERVMAAVVKFGAMPERHSFSAQTSDPYVVWRAEESGRREMSKEHLISVADVYSLALALGQNPLEVVADVLKASTSTAARWVRKAREHGMLAADTMQQRAEERR